MKVVEQRIMRGPNYWSVKHPKIIVLKVDLEDVAEVKTNEIPGFADRLEAWFPGMYKHRSTEDIDGGFFKKVREGTDLSKVIQHVALELQTMAGMDSGYGRSCPADEPGTYTVIFSYQEEQAGEYAANAAIRVTRALVANEPTMCSKMWRNCTRSANPRISGPAPTRSYRRPSAAIFPTSTLPATRLYNWATASTRSAYRLLLPAAQPVCRGNCRRQECHQGPARRGRRAGAARALLFMTENELQDHWDCGLPLGYKPLDGNHGKGATINITKFKDAQKGFKEAQKYSNAVIVERFIRADYRLLVINGKFVAAAMRTPAAVTGDGVSTIQQLIDR